MLYLTHKETGDNNLTNKDGVDKEEDREVRLVKNLYESCHAGYRNYMVNEKVTREMAINCSKYLFFRKSESRLPLDRLFRYTTKIADDVL